LSFIARFATGHHVDHLLKSVIDLEVDLRPLRQYTIGGTMSYPKEGYDPESCGKFQETDFRSRWLSSRMMTAWRTG
jgi:hypothetical protein